MERQFGQFVPQKADSGEFLKIGFLPSSISLQQRWRNNGLSADFLGGYLATFFPNEDPSLATRQAEIRDAVSFIANELLENAMKFSYASDVHLVSIEMFLEKDSVFLYTLNSIDPASAGPFQAFLERLATEDPETLYVEQLEKNASDDTAQGSGLGFLTMLNDYGVTLGWRFDDALGEGLAVTTMVRIPI